MPGQVNSPGRWTTAVPTIEIRTDRASGLIGRVVISMNGNRFSLLLGPAVLTVISLWPAAAAASTVHPSGLAAVASPRAAVAAAYDPGEESESGYAPGERVPRRAQHRLQPSGSVQSAGLTPREQRPHARQVGRIKPSGDLHAQGRREPSGHRETCRLTVGRSITETRWVTETRHVSALYPRQNDCVEEALKCWQNCAADDRECMRDCINDLRRCNAPHPKPDPMPDSQD